MWYRGAQIVYGLQLLVRSYPRTAFDIDLAAALGADRVLEPRGALPQGALLLDSDRPPGETELAVDVELLNLDASSHRQIREACAGDAATMGDRIGDIVRRRGKMHNPDTGSGGVLVGQVAEIGSRFPADGLALGEHIVVLASLTLIPLRLLNIGPVDPASPQVPVRGRAIVPPVVPWAIAPHDLPIELVLAALDVYGAPSHTRALVSPTDRVLILGAGRAGLLCAAAAREVTGDAEAVTVVDVRAEALRNLSEALPGVRTICADATDALQAHAALTAADAAGADVTVVVVNQPHCELSAILATASTGVVLLFSMATSFTAAALGAEGVASTARLLVGNGYAPDRGDYALQLLRADGRLREAFARRG